MFIKSSVLHSFIATDMSCFAESLQYDNYKSTKKMNRFLSILFLFGIVCLNGCHNADEPFEKNETKDIDVQEMYYDCKKNLQLYIGKMYCQLEGNTSRANSDSIDGKKLISLITSVSSERIDSLYNKYYTPGLKNKMDEYEDAVILALEANATPEEICNLRSFFNEYCDIGGHNMPLLEDKIKNSSPFIKSCMIRVAVVVDEFVSSPSRAGIEYCIHNLEVTIARSVLFNFVDDAAIIALAYLPEVSLALELAEVGMDFASALEVAHEFDQCRRAHGVIVM